MEIVISISHIQEFTKALVRISEAFTDAVSALSIDADPDDINDAIAVFSSALSDQSGNLDEIADSVVASIKKYVQSELASGCTATNSWVGFVSSISKIEDISNKKEPKTLKEKAQRAAHKVGFKSKFTQTREHAFTLETKISSLNFDVIDDIEREFKREFGPNTEFVLSSVDDNFQFEITFIV